MNFLSTHSTMAIIGIILMSTGFSAHAMSNFADVLDTHPNAEAIMYAKETGLVQGYDGNVYRPDNTMNKAEFTKITVAALFSPDDIAACLQKSTTPPLSDVPADSWFAPFVCMGQLHGIIKGNPNGTFTPSSTINVAEASTIVARAFGLKQEVTNIWYEGSVRALGEMNALPSSFTSFTDPVTRGEMAEMIFRVQTNNTYKESTSYAKLAGIPEDDTSGAFTYQNYKDGVVEEHDELILFFHAQWCPFCRVNHERLLKLEEEGALGVPVYKVDYDTADELRKRFGVTQQDTFLRIAGGSIVDETSFPSFDILSTFVE